MYTVVINVPFRRKSPDLCEVSSDWAKSLLLLRDSLNDRFGRITVAAPLLPPGDGPIGQQTPQLLSERNDGIRFVALGETRWRARHFWRHSHKIRATCIKLAQGSDVVHAGIGNLWQPYAFFGFCAGHRMGTTTIFVQDGDMVQRIRDLTRDKSLHVRLRTSIYCALLYQFIKWGVARADLSLLKGQALHQRYGRFARNAKDFYDTSFHAADIIPLSDLTLKCDGALKGHALRCLVLGRLVDFKCIDHAIHAVVIAARSRVRIQLDIIGDGPDKARLKTLVKSLGAEQFVHFLGGRLYGPELLRDIASYHILLFTSLAEEPPRSLFDAMAGGCSLLAYDIPYTRQVIDQCRHGHCVPKGNVPELARRLCELDQDRPKLIALMQRAAEVSEEHSADKWYKSRAAWTIKAYERHQWSGDHGRCMATCLINNPPASALSARIERSHDTSGTQ